MAKIQYDETQSFQKDFKKLSKKYKTLQEDLETAKRNAIELYHLKNINNESVFPLQKFYSEKVQVFKLKKFACKALKGKGAKSGIRVIYAFYPESLRVEFVEMYYKGDKANEDKKRIQEYLKNQTCEN